jgi:Lon protease-like protein
MSVGLLPLFPLQVVLFPGSSLPLHIFEERYKTLISECLEERKEFGVNLVHQNEMLKVGCTAAVSSVVKRFADGRMDIAVVGRNRYELLRYEVGRAAYLVGDVRYLASVGEDLDRALAEETVVLYNELVSRVYNDKLPQIEVREYEQGLSFVLAQKSGMDLLQRQRLLELSSENGRLEMIHAYLTGAIPRLDKIEEIERVIQSDGYL